MDGLRKFSEVDNHEAVNVGGLRQGTKSVQVVKKGFTADFPEAVIREGAEELTFKGRRSGLTTHLHRHDPCGGRAMGT